MLRTALGLGLLLAFACGRGKPRYSEEIIGREEITTPPTAATPAPTGGGPAAPAGTSAPAPPPRPSTADCEASYDAPVHGGISGTLQCGAELNGTTTGGRSSFGDEFYQRAFCSPARQSYDDAPEAIYAFELPANDQATITLDSPCADLDLVAIAWTLDGLPTTAQVGRVRECEMNTRPGGGTVNLTAIDRAQTYLIVVDGKKGAVGNFSLKADCKTYR